MNFSTISFLEVTEIQFLLTSYKINVLLGDADKNIKSRIFLPNCLNTYPVLIIKTLILRLTIALSTENEIIIPMFWLVT